LGDSGKGLNPNATGSLWWKSVFETYREGNSDENHKGNFPGSAPQSDNRSLAGML
jgi:hypothetical protein